MKTEPIQIASVDLFKFIDNNKISVIKAGLEEVLDFNSTLNSQLNQFYKNTIKIGFINIESLDYTDEFVRSLIGEKMINIGLESSDKMLPGYYLFKDSRLVAYHPGTFDISKLDPQVQKATIWTGIALAVIAGLSDKSFATALLTFSATLDASTGMNISKFFKEILESKDEVNILKKQKAVFLTEIDKAYAFLKVSKFASDDEVKKAWRNMQKEFHPDASKTDKDKRTIISAHINEAYELIVNHRKATKTKFSFS
ncbi:J domain-containing protein [Flavobacterium sp. J27]|uniref:J domain-containing protein n=1 Tax=Flavobacterium sp. J27 TaxID=2060419 RepID=UPI00102F96BD|nr:J domain-containing protein [Flavobacterium sp. J27]